MKIACPSCSAKYSIADEKVENRLAKIRCRKCGTTIVIDGKASPPTVHAGDGAGSGVDMGPSGGTAGDEYTVDVGENDQRTMSIPQIVDAYNTAIIAADTYVWKDGMADWMPLADVPEINEALHAAASAAQPEGGAAAAAVPTPDSSTYDSSTYDSGSSYGTGAGSGSALGASALGASAYSASALAASSVGRGGSLGSPGADLFGGIDAAGGESDIQTSAPEGGAGISAATGARNESSVLFSLSALTAAQEDAKPAGSASAEDSGLIDLAALTSAASTGASTGSGSLGLALGSAPLAPAPLGAAPLSGGTAASLGLEAMQQSRGNKNGLFIGGGLVVAVLLAGLFAFLLKEEPQPVAAAPTATVVVTAIVPAAAPTAEEEVARNDEDGKADDAEDAKDSDETASAAAAKKKVYRPPPKKSSGSTGSGSSSDKGSSSKSPASDDSTSKKKKKKKSSCNCAPSDLMCAMKCSSK